MKAGLIRFSNIPKLLSSLVWDWKAINKIEKLWSGSKYHELILLCDAILERHSRDHLALYYKGLANESLSLLDDAILCFQEADEIVARVKWRRYFVNYAWRIPPQLSRLYNKKQNAPMAIYYAHKAILANKKGVEGLKWRAVLKEDIGDFIGASEDLNEAFRRRPKDAVLRKMRDRLTYIIIEHSKDKSGV